MNQLSISKNEIVAPKKRTYSTLRVRFLTRKAVLEDKKQELLIDSNCLSTIKFIKEIKNCLEQLVKHKSMKSLQAIFNQLYRKFIPNLKEYYPSKKSQNDFTKLHLKDKREEVSPNHIIHLDHMDAYESVPKGEELHFREKQIAAKALCYRGSGMQAWMSQMKHSNLKNTLRSPIISDERKYKETSEKITIQTIRGLQKIIIQQCRSPINRVKRQQMYGIIEFLCSCTNRLPLRQLGTYLTVMKAIYGLQSSNIAAINLLSLFHTLQNVALRKQYQKVNLITKKVSQNKVTYLKSEIEDRQRLDQLWSQEMEDLLIKGYKIEPSLQAIHEYFLEIYPQYSSLFSFQNLKYQLQKILILAVKKIKLCLIKHNQNQHQFLQYDERLFKFIDNQVKLAKIYCKLIDFFKASNLIIFQVKQLATIILSQVQLNNNDCMSSFLSIENSEYNQADFQELNNQGLDFLT